MAQSAAYLCRADDTPDMNRLVAQYGDELLRLCALYLRDTQLAEDAVQETYIRVYRGWGGFRGNCSEKTWITSVAMNVCKTQLRASWRKRIVFTEDLPVEPSYEDPLHDGALLDEIQKLPSKYRQVILLFYYQELKATEIASALGLTESAVTVRLSRAREQLRKAMKGRV